ncbi:gluconate 5-dehydrogenase [Sulfobacillus thermosulfidooxidans DSM 9293]|uniref:Gluconate 5-dehydrogenase n=1 Tax=Sulfobacillus thermosulfidooxidans (strain DSM 9293 / VKM B-1269 / AT-1) TaxID=929705 RepID=A0A1W1WC57_SULTA|nr:SDR family oxidoreductase [Sulfobacillus thermosulfidooxidans]SMC03762.1 gluconate 5-dehydrogenase [Sulfobacillus thermosulfidooxidans DSM 9293]
MTVGELMRCDGKVALVTGGGRGLGRILATTLAEAGADVAICSRKLKACEETAELIKQHDRRALALTCDVTQVEDVDRVVNTVIAQFGRIDILVNNSGATWGASALEMPLAAWHKVIETNLTGTFLMSQRVARVMSQQGGGKIINVASVMGLVGSDPEILDAIGYSASKGAIITLTKDLAVKWGKYGITVNAIAPGFFPTKMSRVILEEHGSEILRRTPLGRFGSDDDLKGVIVLLASRASDFMTGSIIVVDGGLTA